MHDYTHEYKMVPVKRHGKTVGSRPAYLGSRCRHENCAHSRTRTVLDVVKAANERTHDFFGTTGQTAVVRA